MAKKKKPSRELGGMAAAFVKSGLSDSKRATKVHHEHRVGSDTLSAKEKQELVAQREAEGRAQREAEAEASRQRAAQEIGEAERASTESLIREHHDPSGGRKRWFFIARDGRVPYVEVSDGSARALADGLAGIVESLGVVPAEHVVLKSRQALANLQEREPELIRFWNKEQR